MRIDLGDVDPARCLLSEVYQRREEEEVEVSQEIRGVPVPEFIREQVEEAVRKAANPTPDNPIGFARRWYDPESVHRALTRFDSLFQPKQPGDFQKPPQDHLSIEFAEWLARHMQLAMVKGMQIAREWDASSARNQGMKYDAS